MNTTEPDTTQDGTTQITKTKQDQTRKTMNTTKPDTTQMVNAQQQHQNTKQQQTERNKSNAGWWLPWLHCGSLLLFHSALFSWTCDQANGGFPKEGVDIPPPLGVFWVAFVPHVYTFFWVAQ